MGGREWRVGDGRELWNVIEMLLPNMIQTDWNSVLTTAKSVEEKEEVSPRAKLEQLGRKGSRVITMVTQQTLTVDSQEKERLEDSMAIAGLAGHE